MLLGGSFLPCLVAAPPISRRSPREHGRSSIVVRCSSPISSPLWEALPLPYSRRKSIKVHFGDTTQDTEQDTVSGSNVTRIPDLSFNRLQITDRDLSNGQKWAFGRYIARGAVLDEEYWTASWLRAEAHYEPFAHMRHVDSFKRKYSEQEFYALKRRCSGRDGNSLKCLCIVAVKKEDPNVRRTVLNSVVGTLDLSIRLFAKGEAFLRELRNPATLVRDEAGNMDLYAYISNVCVSKFARRQGIASNMLCLATDIAVSSGMEKMFVHVAVDNKPARDLYKKNGFEIVESCPVASKDAMLLMWKDLL